MKLLNRCFLMIAFLFAATYANSQEDKSSDFEIYKNLELFELVYKDKGVGQQINKQNEFPYARGNIFFFTPLDCYSFKIKEKTTFYFISFTDLYFSKKDINRNYHDWFKKLSYILSNYNKIAGDIIRSRSSLEKELLVNLIKQIHHEYLAKDDYSDTIIESLMVSILNILVRNIACIWPGSSYSDR